MFLNLFKTYFAHKILDKIFKIRLIIDSYYNGTNISINFFLSSSGLKLVPTCSSVAKSADLFLDLKNILAGSSTDF